MKIAFLCPSVSRACGGIFEIERRLAQSLAQVPRTALEIFGPSDAYTQADLPSWLPLKPRTFAFSGPSSFRYSSALQRSFLAVDVDLVHLHALWMHNSIVVRKWVQRWNRPYLITANGMLDPWALRNSGWKKRVALALYERNCLNGAACIQVNSQAEYRSVRAFGLSNPVCIIPNGIDLPEGEGHTSDVHSEVPWKGRIPPEGRVLLYLGRLHPKKGLINLLRAWKQVDQEQRRPSGWTLAIAGWDQAGHQNELKKLASELQLLSSVVFLGPQFGRAKSACYRNCNAFILPSFSEGLPMVVLEAWSYGKPVLMTGECNLPEGFSARAALRIEPDIDGIAAGLRKLFDMPCSETAAAGQRGLELVRGHFAWPRIAAGMRSVYAWMLGRGPRPECIVD